MIDGLTATQHDKYVHNAIERYSVKCVQYTQEYTIHGSFIQNEKKNKKHLYPHFLLYQLPLNIFEVFSIQHGWREPCEFAYFKDIQWKLV